jgi:hypothetical protein
MKNTSGLNNEHDCIYADLVDHIYDIAPSFMFRKDCKRDLYVWPTPNILPSFRDEQLSAESGGGLPGTLQTEAPARAAIPTKSSH